MTGVLVATWVAIAAVAASGRVPARTVGPPRRRSSIAAMVGAPLLSVAARITDRAFDPGLDRVVGRIAVVSIGASAIAVPLGPVIGVGAVLWRWWRTQRRRHVRPGLVVHALPDLVDVVRLAVSSGCTLPLAIPVAATWGPPLLRPALATAGEQLDRGTALDDALRHILDDWGPPAEPLIAGLVDHARYGTPLEPTLDRVGDEIRRQRRHLGEARIRRLPVTLLFPLVLCTLPAFALLTVGPLVAGSLLSIVDGGLGAAAPAINVP